MITQYECAAIEVDDTPQLIADRIIEHMAAHVENLCQLAVTEAGDQDWIDRAVSVFSAWRSDARESAIEALIRMVG